MQKIKKKAKKNKFSSFGSDWIGLSVRFGSDKMDWIGSDKLEWIGLDRMQNFEILRIRIGYGYEILKTDRIGWIHSRMLAYGSDTDRIG